MVDFSHRSANQLFYWKISFSTSITINIITHKHIMLDLVSFLPIVLKPVFGSFWNNISQHESGIQLSLLRLIFAIALLSRKNNIPKLLAASHAFLCKPLTSVDEDTQLIQLKHYAMENRAISKTPSYKENISISSLYCTLSLDPLLTNQNPSFHKPRLPITPSWSFAAKYFRDFRFPIFLIRHSRPTGFLSTLDTVQAIRQIRRTAQKSRL